MACRLLVACVCALAARNAHGSAPAGSKPEFLARRGPAQDGDSCVADGQPCKDGVDCCGVCAYIGADTWQCLACTPSEAECIPMGNRCCDGGNKQRDIPQQHPGHVCRATTEVSKRYGITKYTCQRTDALLPAGLAVASQANENGMSTRAQPLQSASSPSAASSSPSVAKALQIGDATSEQLRAILSASRDCFDQHPVDTSNLGQLQGTLGAAVGCVQEDLESRWGWRPLVDVQGSASCGQCDGYGRGATVIEADTDSGNWMLVMRLMITAALHSQQQGAKAEVLQRGNATDIQLSVILRATEACFAKQRGRTRSPSDLYARLGSALSCTQSTCEAQWGWEPHVGEAGSRSCGRCDGHGLGATVIAVHTAWEDWVFVMRLK